MRLKFFLQPSLLFIFSLFLVQSTHAQKQKRTYKTKKFAKKALLCMAPNQLHRVTPDEEAIQFIMEATDRSEKDVIRRIKSDTSVYSKHCQWLNENEIWRALKGFEVKNKKEKNGLTVADIVLHCKFKGKEFNLILKNCLRTNVSWYIGSGIDFTGTDMQDKVDEYNRWRNGPEESVEVAEETTEESSESTEEAVSKGVNTDENINNNTRFPEPYNNLVNTWMISQVYEDGKDKTTEYLSSEPFSNPKKMSMLNDGTLIYLKGYRDKNNVSYAKWEYEQEEQAEGDKPAVTLILTIYNNEGNYEKEKYALSKISQHEMVLEIKSLSKKYVWKNE